MSYTDTLILVADDCPATTGVVPPERGGKKSVLAIEYELLSRNPYRYTEGDLLFEVHVRHKQLAKDEIDKRGAAIRDELLSTPHPCLRASALPKTYGWGVHYDAQGRIAIYPAGSDDYRRLSAGKTVKAMRSKRA